jgi:hypothetical protein
MPSLSPKHWRHEPGETQGTSRRLPVVLALAAGLVLGAGAASGIAAAMWPQGRQASVGSILLDAPAVHSGPFLVQAREMRCGLGEIVGTHAEFTPKLGQFCRVRVDVTAEEAAEDTWDSLLQQVATADGASTGASLDAMHVKRQPLQITLGGHAMVEMDLWFDLPQAAQPSDLLIRATATDTPAAIPLPRHTWPFGAAG